MASVNRQLLFGCHNYILCSCWGKDYRNLMEKPTLTRRQSATKPSVVSLGSLQRFAACGGSRSS